MRKALVLFTSALVLLGFADSVRAAFHIMRISEVMAQYHGDPRIQFVELQMAAAGQNFVQGHKLIFQDASGQKTGEVAFASNVAGSANGSNILIGTQAFKDAFGVNLDLLLPEGLMAPFSGRVCFDAIDCVAYGDFAGSNTGFGTPAPRFPVDGSESLTLLVVTPPGAGRNNSKDYAFRSPTPKNNAGAAGTMPAFTCFVRDNFANMSQWDQPAEGGGLDLTGCGGDGIDADIGFADVSGGALVLTPGTVPLPNLPAPICFTGLKNAAARAITEPNHRVKFNMSVDQGVAYGAVFTHEHYSFDDGASTINVSQSVGLGVNFTFDGIAGEVSDHLHGDVRTACIAEGRVDGEDDGPYPPGFLLMSQTEYTLILDADGDDEAGPITLQVKLFAAGDEEPIDYLATYKVAAGLGADPSEDLDHGVLIAALSPTQSAMEIRDFSICGIPRNQKHVRCLSCVRNIDGSILVSWNSPFDAENKDISIAEDGTVVGTVSGFATEFTIADAPHGETTITVTNYSGIPASCTVPPFCADNPPTVVIDGPAAAELQDGSATVMLDSSASNDGDDGAQSLTRTWEIVTAPAGASASLDNPAAVKVNMNVNAAGAYVVRLTIDDSGCPGSPAGQSASAERTITVSEPGAGGRQKPNDENQDGKMDLSDAVAVLNYLFTGTNPSLACGSGDKTEPSNIALLDANGDGKIDLSDPIRLLGFLFLGAARPASCTDDTCPCIAIKDCANTPSCP